MIADTVAKSGASWYPRARKR